MKKILFMVALFAATSMTVFVGCSKDDDDKKDGGNGGNNGGGSSTTEACWEIKVSASGVTYSTTYYWGTETEAEYIRKQGADAAKGSAVSVTKNKTGKSKANCN